MTVLWFHIRCGLFSPHNSIRNEKQPNDKSQFCDYSSCTKLIRQVTWVAGGTQQTSIWSPVTFICPTVARSVSRCRQKTVLGDSLLHVVVCYKSLPARCFIRGPKGCTSLGTAIWACDWLERYTQTVADQVAVVHTSSPMDFLSLWTNFLLID